MLHLRLTKTQASLCRLALAFVTNIHKVWIKIKTRNKIWTSRKSLTDQRNDTLAGDMPTLTNSDVFNLPIKSMASGFNSLHAGIFSMLFVHLLISPDLGPNCFTKVISRRHLYIKSVARRPYHLSPRAIQNHFHGIDHFAPIRQGGDKSIALSNCRYNFQYLTPGKRNNP